MNKTKYVGRGVRVLDPDEKKPSRTLHNGIAHLPNLMRINIHMYTIPARGPQTVLWRSLQVMCTCAQSVLTTRNNQNMWGVGCVSWIQMKEASRTFHNGITHMSNLMGINIHMYIFLRADPKQFLPRLHSQHKTIKRCGPWSACPGLKWKNRLGHFIMASRMFLIPGE